MPAITIPARRVLATGGIDAVLSEFNCTLPGIEPICDELMIKQICLDDVAKKANAQMKPFVFEKREEQSWEIIDEIIEAYKERRGQSAYEPVSGTWKR